MSLPQSRKNNKNVPGPESYVSLLDDVVKNRGRDQADYTPLRPSNAGSCARRIAHDYLAFLGKAPKKSEDRKPSVERLLSLGHFIEDHLIRDLKSIPEMAVRFTQQVVDMGTLPLGTRLEGSTDFAMWSEEHKGLGDVKSIGDRWEAAFSSKWEKLMATYRKFAVEFGPNSFYVDNLKDFLIKIGSEDSLYKNLVQLNMYACSDFFQSRGINHAVVIRYNKNNSALMEIRFTPDLNVFAETISRLSLVEKAGAEGNVEIAPKERVLGHMDCTYCPYKEDCWPKASKKEFYKNFPKKQWATRTNELQMGTEIEELFKRREEIENNVEELSRIDQELIQLIDGHNVTKVKLDNGTIYEVSFLQKGAVLRRGKE